MSFFINRSNKIFTLDMNEYDFNTINMFVGILHTSSTRSYTTNKNDTIKKEFTPFVNFHQKILVKTKRIIQSPDVYIIARYESTDSKTNIVTCIVHEYLDEVGSDVDINKLLKALSTCNWTRKNDKLFNEIVSIDITPKRLTLDDNIEIYSIDPEGSKDIDDALHCVKTIEGWQIGIHIADVSSYIAEGSVQDLELSKRVETFYSDYPNFPHQNMIPNIISLECASLLDTKMSRSFSAIIDYDNEYNIINVVFQKMMIKVKKNLSYDNAQCLIDKCQNQSLINLYNVAKHFYKGSEKTYDTHEMVAIYMILINKLVAEHLSKVNPSGVILRVQRNTNINNNIFLQKTECENKTLCKKYMNSLYEKAFYEIGLNNESYHFSLDVKYYTHFSSPIRRYVDILTHRDLYNSISGKNPVVPSNKIINSINTYQKYYKRLQRHTKLLYKLENLNTIEECEAYIISLNSDKNTICVYIENIDLEINIKIINRKFNQILENISDDENELAIINTQTANGLTLRLFQKIVVQIVQTQSLFEPITTTIINPNIQEILNLA